jgi:uncharacterized membrane protein
MTGPLPVTGSGLSKHRVEALTDGIYAVAMTLLVLELKLPEARVLVTETVFAGQLLHLIPKFFAWIISFFILAIFWFSHQRAFHYVRAVDAKLLWINVVSLAFASLLPFSSALVGEYGRLFAPQVVYAANMAALSLAAIWQLDHLEKHPELCYPSPFPRHVAKAARFRCWSLCAVAALAVVIATFDPRLGTLAFMLMIILGRVGRRIEAREAEKATLDSTERNSQ